MSASFSPTPISNRKLPHGRKAEQLGVSTRTLDRWIDDGTIAPPHYVNGRKYHDEDSRPRLGGRRTAASPLQNREA